MRREKAVRMVAIALVVSFLATVAGLVALDSDDSENGKVSEAAQDLLELLDRRDDSTYHARYEADTPGTERLVLETWQAPPSVRQDSEIRAGAQLLRSRILVKDERRVRCTQRNNTPWECRPAAPGETDGDPLATFRARLGQGTVTATSTAIDGRKVRCFSLTTGEGRSELCALPESGIPVRVEGGGSQLRLVALDYAVDRELFEPPVPVAGS
jgi:hypothetical protein